MKLLILGGTAFLGPQIVENALARGHELTLFNRGRTNPHLFPDLEKLKGDRDPQNDDGLKALEGRAWDAVIDTSGYVPRHVKASAELLGPRVRQYVFVSTISVFADSDAANLDENSPVGKLEDETIEQVTGQTYGPLKALCEAEAEKAMPGRVANIRPGLIVGPGDPTDRFTYWPVRIDRGGEVLAPQPQDAPVQFIDVRDLAEWIVRMVEEGHAGVYNAVGPRGRLSMAECLHGCRAATSSDVTFTWVDEAFLLERKVGPWMEMPLWVPRAGGSSFGTARRDRAIAVGLTFRPLAVTARDTIDWHKSNRPAEYEFGERRGGGGMTAAREQEVLAAWRARGG
jgi:2'-hydroxyisoflavone reductase